MSLTDTFTIEMNVADVVRNAAIVRSNLDGIGISFKTVTSESNKMDAAGDILSKTLRGIDTEGNKVTTTLKNIKGVMTEVGQSVTYAKERFIDAGREYSRLVQSVNTNKMSSASIDEKEKYAKAKAALKQFLQDTQITKQQLAAVERDIKSGNFNAYADADQNKLRQLLVAKFNAVEALGRQHEKEMLRIQKEGLKQQLEAQKQHDRELKASIDAKNKELKERAKLAQQMNKDAYGSAPGVPTQGDFSSSLAGQFIKANLILGSINRVRDAFTSGINESIKFEQTIARVQTLSQGLNLSTKEWSESVLDLSRAYGSDARETAQAYYDALSNQVAKTQKDLERFTITAVELAQVTGSTVPDAGNILSSAMNAFGISVTRAGDISAKTFKMIDLGRVNVNDLADSLGRTAVPAQVLGVSMEELYASIATLTVQGVSTADAQTQMLNLMNKLIKPSEELQKHFAALGFESGQQAVQVLGFTGVLKELDKTLKAGGLAQLGKELNDIRGFRGAIGLLGKNFETYISYLEQIGNSQESYANATKLVFENNGKIIDKEINKIKSNFTQMGQNTIGVLVEANSLLGGFGNKLSRVIEVAIPAALAIGAFKTATYGYAAALAAEARAAAAAAAGQTAHAAAIRSVNLAYLGTPTGLVIAGLAAVTGAVAYSVLTYESAADEQKRISKELSETTREDLDREIAAIHRASDDRIKTMTETARVEMKLATDRAAAANKVILAMEDETKAMKGLLSLAYNKQNSFMTDYVNSLEKDLDRLETARKRSTDKIKEINQDIKDARVAEQLEGATPREALEIYQQQYRQALQEAAKYRKANDIKSAQEALETAEKSAKDIERLMLQQTREIRAAEKAVETARDAQRFSRAKDKTGLAERVREAEEELKIAKSGNIRVDAAKMLTAVKERHLELEKQITAEQDKATKALLAKQAEAAAMQMVMQLNIEELRNLDKGLLRTGETPEQAMARRQGLIDKNAEILGKTGASTEWQAAISKIFEDSAATTKKLLTQTNIKELSSKEQQLVKQALDARINADKAFANQQAKTAEALKQLENDFKAASIIFDKQIKSDAIVEGSDYDPTKIRNRNKVREALENTDFTSLASVKSAIQATREFAKTGDEYAASNAFLDARQFLEQAQLQLAAQDQTRAKIEELINVTQAASTQDTGALIQELYHVREQIALLNGDAAIPATRAAGGRIHGSDNTLIGSNEYVMNGIASQRFAPQLSYMNSGMWKFGADRGSNLSVGDVNVSINATGNQQIDAVQIGQAIRREIKRGVLKL